MTMRNAITALVLAAGTAAADVATFDTFNEGNAGPVVTDAGIMFSGLSRRIDGDPVPVSFAIEQADADLAGQPGFTPNNTLGFGGWAPGPGTGFSRFGQMDITPAEPSTFVSLHMWDFTSNPPGTTIILEAFRDGSIVGSETVPLITTFGLHHYEVVLDGVEFDALRLRIGPTDDDVTFAVLDTVTIKSAPACAPDCNQSGDLTPADFACFRDAFLAGDDYGDFDGDGDLTPADFAAFRNAFLAGCP